MEDFIIARDNIELTSEDGCGPTLKASRDQFLDVISPYLLGFATLAVVISLYRSWTYGWYHTMVMHTVMYLVGATALLLRHRIPGKAVIFVLLFLVSLDCFQSVLNTGLMGGGLVAFVGVCILASAFLGLRAGLSFVAAGIVMGFAIAVGFHSGLIAPRANAVEYLRTPVAWGLQLACFVLYTVPLIIAMNVLGQRMTKTSTQLKETNLRLQREILMREQAEGNYRDSERRYHNVVEHAAEGIFQATSDGDVTSANPALARMMGYSTVQEMITGINERGDALCAERDDEIRLRSMLEKNGYVQDLEIRLNGKQSGGVWARVNIRRVYFQDGSYRYQGTVEDITGHRLAETALRESEVKYRSVVESSLVASCIVQDGFFRFVNTTFCTVTGFSRKELVDRMMPSDIIHPDHKRAWQDGLRRISGDPSGRLELELKILSRSRSVVTLKVLAGSTTYNGRMAIFGTFVDVTNEKTLEAQLHQAQKMEAIGTLAGGIAHDFNNILTALTGYATLLKMEVDGSERLGHYADQILTASEKAANLTRSLLAFGRKQPVTLKAIDMNVVIRETESLLRRLITDDITFVTEMTAKDVMVMADSTQIDQILFNFVANARDAMPQGGRMTIRTDRVFLGQDFIAAHGFGEIGEYILLSVSDSGIGMDREIRERIFEPFYTTKEAGMGTGLGLSTVYSIVKQHKGYITVLSEPSQGSTFSVYLPVAEKSGEEKAAPAAIPANDRNGSATVLIADDNAELRTFVRDMLEVRGYHVIEAVDGEDALNKFIAHDHISLVVLDSVMPKRNGRQVCDAMRAARPATRALFISGHTADTVLEKGIEEGRVDFMQKPLDPEVFVRKVGDIISRRET
jgi:PAS domain S-box-containing protein